ncbi:MAG: hypothetical protein WBZ24_09680 [Anaerolineales bacterium]|jgi:hypothetical protein
MQDIFPCLIVNARPAAGKSEILAYLAGLDDETRGRQFHVGRMKTFDDFPMLWTWFEEDELLEHVFDRPRLHTTPDSYFIHHDLWHLLIRRLARDYERWRRDSPPGWTGVIEFSRGVESGGYRAAYPHLSRTVLEQAAVLYIQVSYEESVRKNKVRENPDRPESILEHSLPDEKMERLYHQDDWQTFGGADDRFLTVGDHRVPYVVFENEDDVTTRGGAELGDRLKACLDQLWAVRRSA